MCLIKDTLKEGRAGYVSEKHRLIEIRQNDGYACVASGGKSRVSGD